MLKATKDKILPTTITGSLPRPSWYTENLGLKTFVEAMVETRFREQYEDALAVYLNQQEVAGLDIFSDGDVRFTQDIGGQSWTSYPPSHMSGFDKKPKPAPIGGGGIGFPRGHILHDYIEARVMPSIVGPVGRGDMQYATMWKAAQRMTHKPVKFGTVTPELVAFAVQDFHYKDVRDRIWAISDAFNEELHELADAGCPVIQMEEPQVHLLAARGVVDEKINPQYMLEVFNNTVRGLRDKTEVWCHTCWGNPSQQRMFAEIQTYKPALEILNKVDADVITFESVSSGGMDLAAIGEHIRSLAAGRTGRCRGRAHPYGHEAHPGRAPSDLVRLRHGTRGNEPAACLLQDGCSGAGDQCRPQGARRTPGGMPARGSEVFADLYRLIRCSKRASISGPTTMTSVCNSRPWLRPRL
jgi:5-methyltetrahydropteroyltriglutamate--homocysteine methyltransferase